MDHAVAVIALLSASFAVSAFLAVRILRSDWPALLKCATVVVIAVPVIGPLFFLFIDMPPRLPRHLRATMNHYGQGGRFIGFGSKRFNYDLGTEEDDDHPSSLRRARKDESDGPEP